MSRPLLDEMHLDALAVSLRDMLARVNRMRSPTWSVTVNGEREAYEFARGSLRVTAVMPNRASGHAFRLQVGAHELNHSDAIELQAWLSVRLRDLVERNLKLWEAQASPPQPDQDERPA